MAIKINLMPDTADRRREAGSKLPIYLLISLVIFLISVLALAGIFGYRKFFLERRLVAAENKNVELQGDISEVLNSKDSRLVINSVVKGKSIKTILAAHPYATNIYAFMEGVTIKSVLYDKLSLEVKDKSVSANISGSADSYKALAKQLIILKKKKEVKEIIFKEAAGNKDGRIGFTIELLLDSSLIFPDLK